MSNRMPPKQLAESRSSYSAFGTMSNRMPPKPQYLLTRSSSPFGTMSNRMPPKPRGSEILTLLIPQIAVVPHKLPTMVRPYNVALLL